MSVAEPAVRPLREDERPWLAGQLRRAWGATEVVSRGRVHDAAQLPALVSVDGDEVTGVATYAVENGACELVTIDALRPPSGVGTALINAVAAEARAAGARRLWLITTNDNLDALRFYQRRGFRLVAVHRDAVAESRRLKPAIPEVGSFGIPLRDELELELEL